MARQMAEFEEATDFLNFCLENAQEFSRRDWLASLTLMTMRKRFSTKLPLFHKYNQRLLQVATTKFDEGVHLLLHRYGVLGYAPAVWHLLPLFHTRVGFMTSKQVSLSAWAFGRTLINDEDAWVAIGSALKLNVSEFSLADLAMIAWALSAVDRVSPPELVVLKQAVRKKLMGKDVGETSSHDLCMLFKAISRLTPQDKRFLEWLFLILLEGMATKTLAFTAQGITSVWATLGHLSWRLEKEGIEALCEETRLLRLDHTFNQDMAAELANALMKLGIDDQRPTYQIVDFIARKGLLLRGDVLLTLVEFCATRDVTHDLAWKRLGVRAQQRGIDLRLPEINRLASAFSKVGRTNKRIDGMLILFTKLREDHAKYGAA